MLDIVNISKTFNPGTVNEKKALSGVSLHMERGDFATIVGSNGAGKSTLFNAIAGGFITAGPPRRGGVSPPPPEGAPLPGPHAGHRAPHDH